jgi:2-polyprenyl-3-methyl-5-hydroxy-6-metoxy-1,4-benzoquinol methylase
MAADWTDKGVQRRIISFSGFRLDGLADLLSRCKGASVFDVGCNRGHVCLDFMQHGAAVLHGCDNYEMGVRVANENFADYRHVEGRFEVVDLRGGAGAVKKAFGENYRKQYDFMLMLAVYHKLRRVMPLENLLHLVDHFAHHTGKYFVWRGSEAERADFEHVLTARGFKMVHYSQICEIKLPEFIDPVPQPCAVWAK